MTPVKLQENNKSFPTFGFPKQGVVPEPSPIALPTPPPRRAKGRWFVGFFLLAICGVAGYKTWDAFLRFQAYGTVEGRAIVVSSPWDGSLRYLHVREGERVRQGQVILTVDNIELRQRYAQLGDELRVAQAGVEGEVARLKWEAAFRVDHTQGSVVTYYEALGNLLNGEAKLGQLKADLERANVLYQTGRRPAISQQEMDQIRYATQGQEQLVAKLKEALVELKKRADQADAILQQRTDLSGSLAQQGSEQLKPNLAKIAALQAERARLLERLDEGQVRSPANGLVVKIQRFAGESCKFEEPLLTVVEEGSLQVVLYVPQQAIARMAVDDELNVVVDPYPQPLTCTVVRFGDRYEPAPDHLQRHYFSKEKLLPVYLQPSAEAHRWMALRVGQVVKLPSAGVLSPPRRWTWI